MFDRRTKLAKEVEQEVRDHAQGKIFSTYIPRNIALAEAPSHGKPIQLYAPESTGAQAYSQLVNEVISSEV
jgi:chromosome partitioning protein